MPPKELERIMAERPDGLSTKELLIRVDSKVDSLDMKLDHYIVSCEVNSQDIKNIKTLGGIAITGVLGIIAVLAGLHFGV